MSDIAADVGTADVTGTDVSTTDVSVSPDSGSNTAPDAGTDIFADANFDKAFGLEPEGEPQEPATDVSKDSEPPVSRQDAKVENTEPKAEGEEAPKADEPTDSPKQDAPQSDPAKESDKLDWSTAPKDFRETHENLKKEFMRLAESSAESRFLTEPTEFAKWMSETSPTSYKEIGSIIATEAANANPQGWIDFFRENHGDLLAKAITGREGMTLDRLQAELSILSDDDDADINAQVEKIKGEREKGKEPDETPDQKRVREILERDERERKDRVRGEVMHPIEQAVDGLVSQAGFEVKPADIQGKKFADLDADTQFKVAVNRLMPIWISMRMQEDPKLVAMQSQLEKFLENEDATSAKGLMHPAQIAVTNFAGELISLLSQAKAKAVKSETEPPTTDEPQKFVKTASAQSNFSRDDGKIDWSGSM